MSMVEAIICITLSEAVDCGRFDDGVYWCIDKVIAKMSSGRRLTRYTVRVDYTWHTNKVLTLKEAREEVARLKAEHEIRPFKPIPIAEMRKVAAEQGFEQAYNILLIGGYGFIEGTVKDYDELLKEFERGMKENADQKG